MILKLGMQHGFKLYKVDINDDPELTLTYFTARSNWAANTNILYDHHVYDHHFQRSSLKPLGQSKPNFMWSLLGKGERKNGPGHMTKMAAMPIYGKNLQKSSPTELIVLWS